MGMFDWVQHPSEPCWNCAKPVSDWQSKDADCTLDTVEPSAVRRFYSSCDACGAWNQYKVIPGVGWTVKPNHGKAWEASKKT